MAYKEWLAELQKDPVKTVSDLFEDPRTIFPYMSCTPLQILTGACSASDAILELLDQGLLEWFKNLKQRTFQEHELFALNNNLFEAFVIVQFLKPQQTLSLLINDCLFWDQWLPKYACGHNNTPRVMLMNIYMGN